jgi:ABC-type antimicrobial peptide transport system permease subunit
MNSYIIAFKLAWNSLRLNILRTSLTVLGVVIGVAAIIIVFAAGDGITRLVSGEIESYGTNVVQTEVKVPGKNSASAAEITSLKLSDMEAIDKLDNVEMSYATSLGQQKVSYGGEGKKVLIFGVSAPYAEIDSKTKLAEGFFFTEEEDRSQANVIVLGSSLREYLFGPQEAVGKFVRVGSQRFRVIGSLEDQGGGFSFLDFNDSAYIPIRTLHNKILGIDYAMYFMHQLRDVNRAEETAEEIRLIMRERHDITDPDKDDFRVSTMAEMLDTLGTVTGAVTYLLLAIVLISLLVGGVGIMNIMYVTVTERTPEIGLRKAMGATAKDVVKQFLIESMLITFWGWFLGVIFGLLAAFTLSWVARYFGVDWQFIFPVSGVVASLAFSLACGLLFGYRPAKQAARLDPVAALRTE